MVDLILPGFNRLRFNQETVKCLIENTDWSHVRLIRVHDDGSSDGTDEYLSSVSWPVPREYRWKHVGGPVAVLNAYLKDHPDGPDMFVKVDSDTLMPLGWLQDCMRVMRDHSELDLLGFECTNDFPESAPFFRKYEPALHIGGIGLMRRRVFERYGLPGAEGRQGWTQFQHAHPDIIKGWLAPSLPVALLDHLPMDPWRSLSEEYIAKGWQRRGWGEKPEEQYYSMKSARLWEWWSGTKAEQAA